MESFSCDTSPELKAAFKTDSYIEYYEGELMPDERSILHPFTGTLADQVQVVEQEELQRSDGYRFHHMLVKLPASEHPGKRSLTGFFPPKPVFLTLVWMELAGNITSCTPREAYATEDAAREDYQRSLRKSFQKGERKGLAVRPTTVRDFVLPENLPTGQKLLLLAALLPKEQRGPARELLAGRLSHIALTPEQVADLSEAGLSLKPRSGAPVDVDF